MGLQEDTGGKLIASNRKARHTYEVLETVEAGIVLTGTEVKSLRQGRANIGEAYATVARGEVWVQGMHISPYEQGSYNNVDPLRTRKLLLHRKEIRKLQSRVAEKGLTLVPLSLYFKKNIAKLSLGICRGKREYDRREDIKRRDAERDMRRRMRR